MHLPERLPSERSFGLLFAAVFAGLAGYGVWTGWRTEVVLGLGGASVLVGLITLVEPRLLSPFNKAWFYLGLLLGKVVSPIILGIIFFGLLTPIALIARLLGRDELRLKRSTAVSYWVERLPPGPGRDSFENQF